MNQAAPPIDGPRLEPADGQPASGLIILLHGVAANGRQLLPLARFLRASLPGVAFVAPHAPVAIAGPALRSWSALSLPIGMDALAAGLAANAPLVDRLIDAERARLQLSEGRVALVGFSQGAMMALQVGLRREEPLAAIVSIAGVLLARDRLEAIRARPPVTLIHGDQDPVIPIEEMEASAGALQAAHVPVTTVTVPGLGHAVDARVMEAVLTALVGVLGDDVWSHSRR